MPSEDHEKRSESCWIPGRDVHLVRACCVAWVLHMAAALTDHYDGIMTWISQPIVGAVVSCFLVVIAWLMGQLLRVPAIGRGWTSGNVWPLAMSGASLVVLVFGTSWGWVQQDLTEFVQGDTTLPHCHLHPLAWGLSVLTLTFVAAHWHRPVTPPSPFVVNSL